MLSLFIFSFLHSENPLYRLAEHIFIGAAAGHFVVMGLGFIYSSAIVPLSKGVLHYIIPLVLGVLMFTTFFKTLTWQSRYPVALIVGTGVGLALRGLPSAQVLAQIAATVAIVGKDSFSTLNNVLIWITTVTAMSYFIFTKEHKGLLLASTRFGRYILLAAFGVSYGGVVLQRFATLTARLQYHLGPDIIAATLGSTVVTIAVLAYSFARSKR
jgi:hypothetical protein